jgi:hypothetical protein
MTALHSPEKTTTPNTTSEVVCGVATILEKRSRLTLAHFSQCGANALFGQSSLPLFFALEAFESLQRDQKPWRFWLAINHGDCSFRDGLVAAVAE